MVVVLDACCAVALALGEMTATPMTERAVRGLTGRRVAVPAVYWYKVRHALLRARRRDRIDGAGLEQALREIEQFRTEADDSHDERRVYALAERHGLSFYDASYLETAIRRGAALATVDGKLAKAAKAENVPTALP